MSLGGYVARRLLQLVPIVLGVTILVFFLIHLVPGDPARTMLGTHATPQRVALLHHEWGLDKPLPVQYWRFLGRVGGGALGSSLFYSVPAGGGVVPRRRGATACPTTPSAPCRSSASAFRSSGSGSCSCSRSRCTSGARSPSAATG